MRPAQKQQAIRTVGIGLISQIDIATENRLDAARPGRTVELDEAKTVRQIGQGKRRHPVGGGAHHRRTFVIFAGIQTHRTVGDRVFAMQA